MEEVVGKPSKRSGPSVCKLRSLAKDNGVKVTYVNKRTGKRKAKNKGQLIKELTRKGAL